ncbi:hypothetical protein Thein_1870 [Thermodesulfatator indicus DSM 15286]|uniref:DUF8196 domain-containing protein n=1 Tax=Thermodesulfatator indicus (strain DSM 15286 / JCM 11887 / CIR29812) TaxID=667014 RepID=F8AC90_THEID|nr:hypothetical protein [Thermodesulfatator indicus]AEH45725.1 hypothetical protein Thein_1870 [Thermodesulfatator indicus DSM 15286]
MPVSVTLIKKISETPPELREIFFSLLEEMEQQRKELENQVTKEEFNELKEVIKEQSKIIADLINTQKRSEERLTKLEITMQELAEAQKRTEKEIAKLTRGLQRTRKELGGLARSVAYALENEAFRYLPTFLKKTHDIEIIDRLIRTTVQNEEVDIFARVRLNGKEAILVGEAVLKLDDASKFKNLWKKVNVVREEFGGEVIPLIITHFAKPEILERAQKAGIIVVQSYEWINS